MIALRKEDEIQKTEYMIKGLDNYNNYLTRNLSLQFKDIDKIYSRIVQMPTSKKNEFIELISNFATENKLHVIRYLASYPKFADIDELLIKERLMLKIKDLITLLAAVVIPILIMLIQIYVDTL